MAESAVTFLLNQLSTWLGEEKNLLGGLRNEAQIIHDDLQQMRAFLIDVDATEETDSKLKAFVKQVREITYGMEDVLESYMFISSGQAHGRIKKLYASIKKLKAKHKLASDIKSLRFRLEHAFKTFKETATVLQGSSSSANGTDTFYDGRGDALLLAEADVVGIEGPKKKLLEWISTADCALRVISVVGMAGLGKSTLVKKVYDDPSLKENIKHFAWVNVSETYKVGDLLVDLVKNLYSKEVKQELLKEAKHELPPGLDITNVAQMKEYIHNYLQNKKYMIVLDDVWDINVWEALRYAFPSNSTHGRGCIIITTRKDDVGHMACFESGGYHYKLKPLPPQKAEELFNRKAFRGGSCPDHLKEISEDILRRCEGLPLAIIVIAGALATKRNKIEEWRKFNLYFGLEVENDHMKRIWKLFSLSYYDLPYYLKACLLYLSIFPEDALLERATIVRLWIIEGLVEAKQGKMMEEIAEGYLIQLSNRSLIQVTTQDGRPKKIHMHDLIREYIIAKAREQNMVATGGSREITLEDRIRCLALDKITITFGEEIHSFQYLRSLLFFGSDDLQWRPFLRKVLRSDCRMLKVLDLRGAPLDAVPNEVFKLYHLKYLSLRNTKVSVIPKLIANLIKLEILDLKNSKVVKLPVEILKLERLRYLVVYEYTDSLSYFHNVQSFEVPHAIGKLVCLQKLYYIDASDNIVKEIGRLTKLRGFGIVKLRKEHGKELCSSLTKLTHLSSLIISALEEDEVLDLQYSMPPPSLQFLQRFVLEGRLEKLPEWIPSLRALTCLILRCNRIRDEDLLEHLHTGLSNLKFLELYDAYDGEGLSFRSGGFERLKILYIRMMRGLRWVRVEKGSMPCLETLEMEDCKAMMELPEGLEHLTKLDELQFLDMGEEFVENVVDERIAYVADEYLEKEIDERIRENLGEEILEKVRDKRREGRKSKLAHIPEINIGKLVGTEWEWTLW